MLDLKNLLYFFRNTSKLSHTLTHAIGKTTLNKFEVNQMSGSRAMRGTDGRTDRQINTHTHLKIADMCSGTHRDYGFKKASSAHLSSSVY